LNPQALDEDYGPSFVFVPEEQASLGCNLEEVEHLNKGSDSEGNDQWKDLEALFEKDDSKACDQDIVYFIFDPII
jgi:hypothetical protein